MKREMINMFRPWLRKVSGLARFAMVSLAALAMWTLSGVGLAQQSVQPTFPSATEAAQRLFQAVQGNQEQDITNILGGHRNWLPRMTMPGIKRTANYSWKNTSRCTAWVTTPMER